MKATMLPGQDPTLPFDRPRIGDGLAADSPALLLHDCLRQYGEVLRTYHWWNRGKHEQAINSYNQSLLRFESALRRVTGSSRADQDATQIFRRAA